MIAWHLIKITEHQQMKKQKLNKLIKGNGGKCPNCNQFTQPIRNQHRLFCSECHIHLWEKPDSKQLITPVSFKKSIFISIAKGFLLALFWLPIWLLMSYYKIDDWFSHNQFQSLFIIAILGICFVIDGFINFSKAEQVNYVCGVDKLEDFKSDDTMSYKVLRGHRIPPCPQCNSHRMANLYWYKRQFLKTGDNAMPKILTDEEKFVGCLHCQSHYEILPKKYDLSKLYVFMAVCVFGLVLFLSYQEIIKSYVSDKSILSGIGLFFAGWFYGLLMSLPREKMNHEPFVQLQKQ